MRKLLPLLLASLPVMSPGAERLADYDGIALTGSMRDAAHTTFEIRAQSSTLTPELAKGITAWFGVDTGRPRRILTVLSLRLGSATIDIPHVAFADLGDPAIPMGIYLAQSERTTLLYVSGGDGAGSYTAKFVVEGGRLIRREVSWNEDDDLEPVVTRFNK